jgi:hypothetical protein
MSEAMTGSLSYLETIEEHFQRARGTGFFRLSPVDWALVEAWQQAGIPLEAVLRGIDHAFENWHKRPMRARTQKVNSIAYCSQAIAAEARGMANAAPGGQSGSKSPFSLDEVRAFMARNARSLREKGHADFAAELESLNLEALYSDLERLEQRLTAVEGKMIGRLRDVATQDALSEARRALHRDLKPYRGKMTADQLAMLERQFLERRLLESAGLPRLSLFYL